MSRSFSTLTCVVLLLAPGCGGKDHPRDWVAAVDTFRGVVLTAQKTGAALRPVHKGDYLVVGSRLETGPDGEAALILRNGGKLTVKPNSVVLLSSKRPESALSLSLQQGTVLSEGSKVEASELMIAVGQQRIRLGSAARATVVASGADINEAPRVIVTYGQAQVEDPAGEVRTLVAGKTLVLTTRVKPDAGPVEPDAGTSATDAGSDDAVAEVVAPELVFYLESVGRGRVLIRRPTDKRFVALRRGQVIAVVPGTRIKLLSGARMRFGPDKGKGTLLSGPGLMLVTETRSKSRPGGHLKHLQGEIRLAEHGAAGKEGSSYRIDGVSIQPRVAYRELDIRIRRQGAKSQVVVKAGRARLVGQDQTVELEAGQQATIRAGAISGPAMPAPSPLLVKKFGTVRVFVNDRLPVTFRWNRAAGSPGTLVQVARSPSMARPMFADVIRREQLTLPQVRKGALYWQVSPIGADGKPQNPQKGRLLLVRDTSFRVLKNYRAPSNTIQHSFGDTVVYYQNRLPRFTFSWQPIEGAASYQLKILREQNLSQPLEVQSTSSTSLTFKPGRLGEGSYLWYVAGRAKDGRLVHALKSHRLSVRYDNATPDLQIISPRNGLRVSGGSVEVRGVTIPGSRVHINGAAVELDKAFRFSHSVSLQAGTNYIIFRVEVPRRGASYYLRRVQRR